MNKNVLSRFLVFLLLSLAIVSVSAAFVSATACGNGNINPGEQCDDGNTNNGDCCSSTCQFESSSTVCRASAGACDLQEQCTGSSATCPADLKSTAQCRASADQCDAAESCNGVSNDCPADAFKAAGTSCDDSLFCNVGETCNGAGACTGGSGRDCSSDNIGGIATCNNTPDSNPFTWDFRNAFTSVCQEDVDSCSIGDSTIIHTGNDNDGDGYASNCGDCDDTNAAVHPGATEVCNGVDDDCDGTPDNNYVPDTSCFLPGVCAAGNVASSCTSGSETVCSTGSATGADNDCNSVDDDCDGSTDEGYLSLPTTCGVGACSATGSTSCVSGNVVDSCTAGTETCNGIDDNCDGVIDEGVKTMYYQDSDGDGFGDPSSSISACSPTAEYNVTDNTDTINGNSASIQGNVIFSVNGTENPNTVAGVGAVTLKDATTSKAVVEFNFDFSAGNVLNLNNVNITVDSNGADGSIIIRGINLSAGATKTAYVNKLSTSNTLCIIDADVTSITVTDDCANGVKLTCNGTNGAYTCTDLGTQFKVEGLTHSAVTQYSYSAPVTTPTGRASVTLGGGGGGGITPTPTPTPAVTTTPVATPAPAATTTAATAPAAAPTTAPAPAITGAAVATNTGRGGITGMLVGIGNALSSNAGIWSARAVLGLLVIGGVTLFILRRRNVNVLKRKKGR